MHELTIEEIHGRFVPLNVNLDASNEVVKSLFQALLDDHAIEGTGQ